MLLVTLMLPFFVSAQQTVTQSTPVVPRLVNFSGKAADTQGKAISGIAGVTFAIYKDQYDGAPLCPRKTVRGSGSRQVAVTA
jgi:hypothetical protein